MGKIYSIENSQEKKISEICPFDISQQAVINEYNTYNEILKIFRKAFEYVDISKIIR